MKNRDRGSFCKDLTGEEKSCIKGLSSISEPNGFNVGFDIDAVKFRIESEIADVNRRLSKTSIDEAQNRTVYLTGLSEGLEKALEIIKDV